MSKLIVSFIVMLAAVQVLGRCPEVNSPHHHYSVIKYGKTFNICAWLYSDFENCEAPLMMIFDGEDVPSLGHKQMVDNANLCPGCGFTPDMFPPMPIGSMVLNKDCEFEGFSEIAYQGHRYRTNQTGLINFMSEKSESYEIYNSAKCHCKPQNAISDDAEKEYIYEEFFETPIGKVSKTGTLVVGIFMGVFFTVLIGCCWMNKDRFPHINVSRFWRRDKVFGTFSCNNHVYKDTVTINGGETTGENAYAIPEGPILA